jgi:glycosyltransferase involved in cell wall biosynthesis
VTETRTIAFFGSPHLGGSYSVYRQLRDGLRNFGWSVRWVGLGREAELVAERCEWTADRKFGEIVAAGSVDEREQAATFLNHIETMAYDAVFTNVLANRVQTNAVRYLDPRISRIMIVHSISPGTYAAARAIRDHVHATVGVSPRIRDDLVLHHGFPRERTQVIANAFDSAVFERLERKPHLGPLRLLSLGRLEDDSKGLFWLPAILRELGNLPFTFTVAGEGRDGAEIRNRLGCYSDRVLFVGALAPREVAAVMAQHDVFLLPSRYEGQSIALVEALASGCVPVASHLRGVTDFVIDEDKTGFLFPVGDTGAAAKFVRALSDDRQMLARMSDAARASAFARFRPDVMAETYGRLIDAVVSNPPAIARPLTREDWRLPAGLRSGLRTLLPNPIKNRLRQLKERWAT